MSWWLQTCTGQDTLLDHQTLCTVTGTRDHTPTRIFRCTITWRLISIGLIHLTYAELHSSISYISMSLSDTGPIRLHLWLHAPSRLRFKLSETARATVTLGSLAPSIGATSWFPGTSVDHDNDNLCFFHDKHNLSVIVRPQGRNIPKQNGKKQWRSASWYRNHSSDAKVFHSSGDTIKVHLALQGIYQSI